MQCKFLLFISLFFCFQFVNGQIDPDEEIEELLKCEIIQSDFSVKNNLAIVNQAGSANELISIQQQEGFLHNSIISEQQGAQNSGYIKQIGSAHYSKLIQQGENNEANFWSVGSKTISFAYQSGSGNQINNYIDNLGFIPKSSFLFQEGNNNKIEVALLGNGFLSESWPKSAIVLQKGNELEVTAKLDSYNRPIMIEQQSGSTGGGMKINISNSDFNFPTK